MLPLFQNHKFFYRFLACCNIVAMIFSTLVLPSAVSAQNVLNLPVPGMMVNATPAFSPAMIQGLTIHPEDPLRFDFIIHPGDDDLKGQTLQDESTKLIKYFMAALTVPEEEMWVNLSPYEKDRIIPESFGDTEMGRDLLAQDYMLKQLTSSLMYPEDPLGNEFWQRVYKRAQEEYGTTDVPVNTFNKVWIVPEKALIYENSPHVFVAESHLKVMLEEDYLALDVNANSSTHGLGNVTSDDLIPVSNISSQIIREIILPEIEREVNEGKTFANLRQISNSVILATWYKDNIKKGLLNSQYVNQSKTEGVDTLDKDINQKIYDRYIQAFEKGVYDFIKEESSPHKQEPILRKYFSGGAKINFQNKIESTENSSALGIAIQESYIASTQLGKASSSAVDPYWDLTQQWYKDGNGEVTLTAEDGAEYLFKYRTVDSFDSGNEMLYTIEIYKEGEGKNIGYIDFKIFKDQSIVLMERGFFHYDQVNVFDHEGAAIKVGDGFKKLNLGKSLIGLAERIGYHAGMERFVAEGVNGLENKNFVYEKSWGFSLVPGQDKLSYVHKRTFEKTLNPEKFNAIGVLAKASSNVESVLPVKTRDGQGDDVLLEVKKGSSSIDPYLELTKKWYENNVGEVTVTAEDGREFLFKYFFLEKRINYFHTIEIYQSGKMVGYVDFEISEDKSVVSMKRAFDLDDRSRSVSAIKINDNLRRWGLGRSLMGLVERVGFHAGVENFIAYEVGPDRNIEFYTDLGFVKKAGQTMEDYDLYRWTFEKELSVEKFNSIVISEPASSSIFVDPYLDLTEQWYKEKSGEITIAAEDGAEYLFKYFFVQQQGNTTLYTIEVYQAGERENIAYIDFKIFEDENIIVINRGFDPFLDFHDSVAIKVNDGFKEINLGKSLIGLAERIGYYAGAERFVAKRVIKEENLPSVYEKWGFDFESGQDAETYVHNKWTFEKTLSPENFNVVSVSKKASRSSSPINGGIDLNPNATDIETTGTKKDFDFDFSDVPNFTEDFNGLIPVIINMTPVLNAPLLLGLTPTKIHEEETVESSSISPVELRKRSFYLTKSP